ncbi:hypothetical protein E2K93_09390 [Thalassotalea sp. HSM 43]|uniref:VOC family protein n=1 Tax=Thalassotalea sp. HSM 43 TaxID=2552945 RepID=UPI0010801790|nr:VOC family protein [Thalassotalea sp. HSM 43]QBY04589.1 hypothetical protein E2K93_09390 [Thalassotalea sp. HSM 43]
MQTSGFNEVVCVVNDITLCGNFFVSLGMHIVDQDDVWQQDGALLAFWQLPAAVRYKQTVLAVADENNQNCAALLRLVQFDNLAELGVEQVFIRANNQIWDTGGVFDFNVRVEQLTQLAADLHKQNVFGASDPCDMYFGPYQVREWLAKCPGAITVAMIERIAPPLPDALSKTQGKSLISDPFNASFIVKDHHLELDFFHQVLGFTILIDQDNVFSEEQANVFAMPHNHLPNSQQRLSLLSADGGRQGTIEIVSFADLDGNDVSEKVQPYNFGITTLRFATDSLVHLQQQLDTHNVKYHWSDAINLSPYGQVKLLALRTPAGNWLEFIEKICSQ